MGMQNVVDTLLMPVTAGLGGSDNHYYSYFNRYTSQDFAGQPGIPGYITSRADITNSLLPDLANGLTKQLFIAGHGANGWVGSYTGDAYLTASDVTNALGNTFSFVKNELTTKNPYRFVFIDGCATASGKDWQRAFGIFAANDTNGIARNKVGYQAFVGWEKNHAGWMVGGSNPGGPDLNVAKAYTQTLQAFYQDWMNRNSLKQCLDNASFLSLKGMAPFPVPQNKNVLIYGDGFTYLATNIETSRIDVIGHSGLYIGGLKPQFDNDVNYTPKTNP